MDDQWDDYVDRHFSQETPGCYSCRGVPVFQTPKTKKRDRKDHIWQRQAGGGYKCLLCGGVTRQEPPMYPTPAAWSPDGYELPLTAEERALIPFSPGEY